MAAAHRDYYGQGGGVLVSPLVYTVNVTNTGSVTSDVVVLGIQSASLQIRMDDTNHSSQSLLLL